MYDPLYHVAPGPQAAPAPSYWHAHTQPLWPSTSAILPATAEVVVIGAGYTGLNAALELAERYQQEVVVVEANDLGWGCSTRNAGFAMPGTGRLGYSHWQTKYGEAVAQAIQHEYQAAFARLERHQQACPEQLQAQLGGYLKIAHHPRTVAELYRQYERLVHYEPATSWLNQADIQTRVRSPNAYAAIHYPQSFGLNPLLLLASIARQAAAANVQLVTHATVTDWQTMPGGAYPHHLQTSRGGIQAAKVIIATNGYTPNQLHASVHGRTLPILSSVLVTRPLTALEQQSIALSPRELVMDTRTLKYYFRLLPDGRLLFGGRGAVRGKDAEHSRYADRLLRALVATFPTLQDLLLEPPAYFWSGWVAAAFDNYPRVYQPADGVFTSMGYCGAGVTFAQLAGQRVAQLAMGEPLPALPFYQTPLPRFPLPRLRRIAQRLYYGWYGLIDQIPLSR
ncbi:Glycine/D-amino acid oxidase [Pseudidiomarina indica]|uniref:Glycine/D-amino acid oxidase n=1 Tax=Pseudidiomarina indica TaxID=1159017 RepID=A0A1G6BDM9_9GAMM|nr:FAD-binding oxidoreductase [Pseudidiomarina indica]SDB18752.1 Glycine/D-amino acid oxidase [Pseudidiomarina indica]